MLSSGTERKRRNDASLASPRRSTTRVGFDCVRGRAGGSEQGLQSEETGRYSSEEDEEVEGEQRRQLCKKRRKKKRKACLPYGKSLKSRLADARTSIHISDVKARDSVRSSPEESDERRREEPEIIPAEPGGGGRVRQTDRTACGVCGSGVCALNMMMKKRSAGRSSL